MLDQVVVTMLLLASGCALPGLPALLLLPLLPDRVIWDEKKGREFACRGGCVVVVVWGGVTSKTKTKRSPSGSCFFCLS